MAELLLEGENVQKKKEKKNFCCCGSLMCYFKWTDTDNISSVVFIYSMGGVAFKS